VCTNICHKSSVSVCCVWVCVLHACVRACVRVRVVHATHDTHMGTRDTHMEYP